MTITAQSNLSTDVAAHKRLMYYALRPQLFFDQVADVDSTDSTNVGASVSFYTTDDLAAATSALTETSDVTAVAMSDSVLTLTLLEYGNAVQTSAKLRGTSFLDVNPTMANVVGYNAGISVDTLAVNALVAGTNVIYSTGATAPGWATTGTEAALNRIIAADTLNGSTVRAVTSKLRAANSVPFADGLYRGYMHPDAAYDFKGTTTGAAQWIDPHVYSSPEGIWNGTVGTFQGIRWMESPRLPITADIGDGAGSTGTVDGYATLVCGQQALAKAFSANSEWGMQPIYVDSPVVDLLKRFRGAGWKHLVRYGVFRQASVWRIISSSTLGVNV